MGRCLEFGPVIADNCAHPMQAGSDSCMCGECGAVCDGIFDGCAKVWARGPQPVTMLAAVGASVNGHQMLDQSGPLTPETQPVASHTEPDEPADSESEAVPSGRADVDHVTPTAPAVSSQAVPTGRADVARWFEAAFNALHEEVGSVRAAVVGEQARTLAAIGEIQRRQSESAPLLTADTVLDMARVAVTSAVTEKMDGINETVAMAVAEGMSAVEQSHAAAVQDLRAELAEMSEVHRHALAALQQSVDQVLAAGAEAGGDVKRRHAAQLKALNRTLTNRFQPVSEALTESAAKLDTVLLLLDDLTELAAQPPMEPAPAPVAPRQPRPLLAEEWAARTSPSPVSQRGNGTRDNGRTGNDTTETRGRRVSLPDRPAADRR